MRRHLYFYTLIPPSVQAAVFGVDPAAWLPTPATRTKEGYLSELNAEGALPRPLARHRVIVDLGAATENAGRSARTLSWRSATAPGLFPVFDGDLELTSLPGGDRQLSVMGTYRPPLAVAGAAGDALVGHAVAEACIRRFVLDVADRMEGVSLAV